MAAAALKLKYYIVTVFSKEQFYCCIRMGILIQNFHLRRHIIWYTFGSHELFEVTFYDLGDRVVGSLLQLSEMTLSFWSVGRMKFASVEVDLVSLSHSSFLILILF